MSADAARGELPPASREAAPWEPRSVRAGGWELTALTDGHFRLDGGSMWGVVPKSLWARMTPPEDDNTILLSVRPFLARRDDIVAVIEVGLGTRWEDKWRGLYGIEQPLSLVDALAAMGHAPEDVTHVLASHCHFDHIGAQVVARDGALRPQFPCARHFAPALEVEVCRRAAGARRASYRPEDVEPILEAGLLETWSGTRELLPGLVAHELGGHSDGVSVFTFGVDEPGESAIFWSDVLPTAHHAQPPYIMAFDIDVPKSFDVRSEWIERATQEGWIGMLYHDIDHPFVRLEREGRRYRSLPCASSLSAPA